jgi:hypothetical protein
MQVAGVEIAHTILEDLVQSGLYSQGRSGLRVPQRRVKELDCYNVSGIQKAFTRLLLEIANAQNNDFRPAIRRACYLYELLNQSIKYLNQQIESLKTNVLYPITSLDPLLEDLIGRLWKPLELKQLGLWEGNAEIIQLSFISYNDRIQREWVDEAIWLNMKSGKIYKIKTYRPYPALQSLRTSDSIFDVLSPTDLYIYPGGYNPKIRWSPSDLLVRKYDGKDISRILAFAAQDYAAIVEEVKNAMAEPLADKQPVILVALHKVYLYGNNLILEDQQGYKLTLMDLENYHFSTLVHLRSILPENVKDFALTLTVNNNIYTGSFSAQPLSLIMPSRIIRLLY